MKDLALSQSRKVRRYSCARAKVKVWVLGPTKTQPASSQGFIPGPQVSFLPCMAGLKPRRKPGRRNLPLCRRPSRRLDAAANPEFVPWSLAGGAVRAETNRSANRYAPSRDRSDVAAEAAAYKTRNLAKIAPPNPRIARHKVSSKFPRISNKTNDPHPHKVSHFFEGSWDRQSPPAVLSEGPDWRSVLMCLPRLVGRGFSPAVSRAVALLPRCRRLSRRLEAAANPGFLPWSLAGGPAVRQTTKALAEREDSARIPPQNSRIKCHTMPSLFPVQLIENKGKRPQQSVTLFRAPRSCSSPLQRRGLSARTRKNLGSEDPGQALGVSWMCNGFDWCASRQSWQTGASHKPQISRCSGQKDCEHSTHSLSAGREQPAREHFMARCYSD